MRAREGGDGGGWSRVWSATAGGRAVCVCVRFKPECWFLRLVCFGTPGAQYRFSKAYSISQVLVQFKVYS